MEQKGDIRNVKISDFLLAWRVRGLTIFSRLVRRCFAERGGDDGVFRLCFALDRPPPNRR